MTAYRHVIDSPVITGSPDFTGATPIGLDSARVLASEYGVDETATEADNTTFLTAAFTAAAGRTVVLPPNQRIKANIDITGIDVMLDGNGSTLVQDTGITMAVRGMWADVTAVTGFATATHTSTSGNGATGTVAELTVAAVPANITVGTAVKVASEDSFPAALGEIQSGQGFIGEHAVVLAVTGTTITLDRQLIFAAHYATTPKVAAVPTTVCEIRNLKLDTDNPATISTQLIISGLRNPKLSNIEVVKANTSAVQLFGCYNPMVDTFTASDCVDVPGSGQYGYGLSFAACGGGIVSGISGSRNRHLFTTIVVDTGLSVADPSPSLAWYGATHDTVISGGVSVAHSGSGFDLHEGSYNCRVSDWVNTGDGTATGIGLRGHGHVASDVHTTGTKTGFNVFASSINATDRIRLVGCTASTVGGNALSVSSTDTTNSVGVVVEGGRYSTDGGNGPANTSIAVVSGNNCDVEFRAVELESFGALAVDGVSVYAGANTDYTFKGGSLRTADAVGNISAFHTQEATATILFDNEFEVDTGTKWAVSGNTGYVGGSKFSPMSANRTLAIADMGKTIAMSAGTYTVAQDFSLTHIPQGWWVDVLNVSAGPLVVQGVAPVAFLDAAGATSLAVTLQSGERAKLTRTGDYTTDEWHVAKSSTNSTTLNLGSHVGSVAVGYFTNWIACPVSGTLDKFSMAITSNDSNNAFTVELERRVTAFAANPVLTIAGAGVVGNAVDNIGEAVVAGDQFRAIVTVADGATPPEDLNATISLTGVS